MIDDFDKRDGRNQHLDMRLLQPAPTTPTKVSLTDYILDGRVLIADRNEYLLALSNMQIPAFVSLSGLSGSGKDHVLTVGKQMGILEIAERRTSRPIREGEAYTQSNKPGLSPEEIVAQRNELLLGYTKFNNTYGFPAESALSHLGNKSVGFGIGDIGKTLPFALAVKQAVPLLPMAHARIDTPSILFRDDRLDSRGGSSPEEGSTRKILDTLVLNWERRQLPCLRKVLGLETLLNVTEREINRHGFQTWQIQPLTPTGIEKFMTELDEVARQRSAYMANLLLTPVNFDGKNHSNPAIQISMHTALLENLIPTLRENGIDSESIYLKGGLAVALYLESSWLGTRSKILEPLAPGQTQDIGQLLTCTKPIQRPYRAVTPDIDFTIGEGSETTAYLNVIRTLSGDQSISVITAKEKPVFKSTKIPGLVRVATRRGAELVELDAIIQSRVMHEGSPFAFTFPTTSQIEFFRRTLAVTSDTESEPLHVSILPPEVLVMEKLTAARGADLHKLDLFDSAMLIATQPIMYQVICSIIDGQKHNPESAFDKDFGDTFASIKRPEDIQAACEELGILSQTVQQIIKHRMFEIVRGQDNNQPVITGLEWNPTSAKKLAFVDQVIRSLDQLATEIHTPSDLSGGFAASDYVDANFLKGKISDFRELLAYVAEFQIGRTDLL